jgi:dihydroorotate dehydrogenase (NAD+) catalytic subunit
LIVEKKMVDEMLNKDRSPDLSVDIGSLKLKNPVMTASGTFGYAKEFESLVDLNRLGAIIVKGLSLYPEKGNPPPRIVETPAGMLNAIGLENVGLERFEKEKLPYLRTLATPVIVNIYGKSISEYMQLAARLNDMEGVSGIEVNISCPNVSAGGMAFGTDERVAGEVVCAVRKKNVKPLIVKLSPNVTDIVRIAKSVENAGADAVSLINTLSGMAVDIETRRPKLANIIGGLSGPAIKPVALRMVWQTARQVNIPVIGVGGIATAQDALEFIIAGATAIQVGTANFTNPRATTDIIDGIRDFLIKNNTDKVSGIIGTLIT